MTDADHPVVLRQRQVVYYTALFLSSVLLLLLILREITIVSTEASSLIDRLILFVTVTVSAAIGLALLSGDFQRLLKSNSWIPYHSTTKTIRQHQPLIYTASRNTIIVVAFIWIAARFSKRIDLLIINFEILVYFALFLFLTAIFVYLSIERSALDITDWVLIIFSTGVGLTYIAGSSVGPNFEPVRTHIFLSTAAISAVLLMTHPELIKQKTEIQSPGVISDFSRRNYSLIGQGLGLQNNKVGSVLWNHRYTLALLVVSAGGLLIRLFEIGELSPYPDEYAHLLAAREMIWSDEFFQHPSYDRAFWIVTFPVYLSFLIFEPGIVPARAMMATINVLAVFPLYVLLKRVDRQFALLAIFLYLFNPWVIAVSRNVREYAVLPFYISILALGLVFVIEYLEKSYDRPDPIGVLRDRPKSIGATVGLLLVPILYAFRIDPLSSFVLVLGLYASFIALIALQFDWRTRNSQIIFAGAVLAGVATSLYLLPRLWFVSVHPEYQEVIVDLFFFNPEQQWYLDRPEGFVVLVILIGIIYSVTRRNYALGFCTLTYCGYFYATVFHFDRGYFRPRYAFHIELWHVIVFAAGIFAIAALLAAALKSTTPRTIVPENTYRAVLIVVLVLSMVNPSQVLLAATLHDNYHGTYTPITAEHHSPAGEGLGPVEEQADTLDLILIHNEAHLEWFLPEVYEDTEIISFSCYYEDEASREEIIEYVEGNDTAIVSSWRANRGCVEDHPNLEDFENVSPAEGYQVYMSENASARNNPHSDIFEYRD